MGVLSKLAETFDKEVGISDIFGTHSLCSSDKDMNVILRELNDSNVFMCTQNRVIVSSRLYTSLKKKPLSHFEKTSLHEWILKHLKSLQNILY